MTDNPGPMTVSEQQAFMTARAAAHAEACRRGECLTDDHILNTFWSSIRRSLITPMSRHLEHAHDQLDLTRLELADLTVRQGNALQLCESTPDVELDALPQLVRQALTTDMPECGVANDDGTRICNRLIHPGDPQHAVIFYDEYGASLWASWHDSPIPAPAAREPGHPLSDHTRQPHSLPQDLARISQAGDPIREHLLLTHSEEGASNMHDLFAIAYHQFIHTKPGTEHRRHTEPSALHPWAYYPKSHHA